METIEGAPQTVEDGSNRSGRYDAFDVFEHAFTDEHHIEPWVDQGGHLDSFLAFDVRVMLAVRRIFKLTDEGRAAAAVDVAGAGNEVVDDESQFMRET